MTIRILKTLAASAALLLGAQAFAEDAYDWSAAEADLADEIANGNWGFSGGFTIDPLFPPTENGFSDEYYPGDDTVCKDYYVTLLKTKTNKGGKVVTVTDETFTYCQPVVAPV